VIKSKEKKKKEEEERVEINQSGRESLENIKKN
jgi:hypothetical protein